MSRQNLVAALAGLALLASSEAFAADSTLRVGEQKTIKLQENASTGYAWRIDYGASQNPDTLRIEDEGYSPAGDGALLGAPGTHSWLVVAIAKGHAHIEFIYQRPWEAAPIERKSWSIDVR